jgi:lipopolysaccharide export system permease protein
MYTIQRYVLRQYIRIFVITFSSLMGVYVVADLMGNLSEFLEHSRETGSYWQSISSYYAARLPWFYDICSRIVGLLAAVLTIGWLQRHNEMTALMAAGISRWRIAFPLVVATIVISLLGAVNREISLPRVRDELCHSFQDLTSRKGKEMTPQYDHETNILLDGESVIPKLDRIVNPRFQLPAMWTGVGRQLIAESAKYAAATPDRPAGYLLSNMQTEVDYTTLPSFKIGLQAVVLTPRDFPWLQPGQVFVVSNLTVEQIQRGRQWQQYSSTMQLVADLHNRSLEFGADTRVLIHARFVQPFLDIVLLFLGLPIAMATKSGGGLMLTAGKNILMIAGFSLIVLISHGLGIHCLISPALAAWLPLLILLPVSVAVSDTLRR